MFYDTHTHTYHSCDSSKVPEDAVKSAISRGLLGIALTDHSDMRLFEQFNIPYELPASGRDADSLAQKYEGKIRVFSGIEISDAASEGYKDRLKTALSFHDFDIVLASVHMVDVENKTTEFSSADFSKVDMGEIYTLLDRYFDYMHTTVLEYDYSTLCHVTYPYRYINGIYKRGAEVERFFPKIEEIFKTIIQKNTALEINTAKCTDETPNAFCPKEELLKMYISLGGKMFTLGSDSHIAGSEGRGFEAAASFLKQNGIDECYYFEKKKPYAYKI